MIRWIAVLTLALGAALGAAAQDADIPVITYDDVNAVASKLYCPVCPNELLVDCQTQACVQWRDEIREQLSAGQGEATVIDSFVRRYGERVLPIPQDPLLRALSLVTPYVIAALALAAGLLTFARWRRRPTPIPAADAPAAADADDYRARLERDLKG